MPYPIPLNQPGIDAVLALLNRDNNTQETFETINFSLPQPTPTGIIRNTKIRVSAISGRGRKGFVDVYYNRIALSDYFVLDPVVIDVLAPETTHDILPYLNERFNLFLEPKDIIDELIVSDRFTLKAEPLSYAWIGSANFSMGEAPLPMQGVYLDVGGGALFGLDSMVLLDIS